jgi:basic membrane protein A
MAANGGTWKPGHVYLGLAEGGVGYSLDANNRGVLTPAIEQRLEQAKADIISGKIKVPEYRE